MTAHALPRVERAVRAVLGRSECDDPRRRRLLGLLRGALTGLGAKLVGVSASFVSVPLLIGHLGPERYGVWVTLGSLVAWMSLTDFGLGNGLTNALTGAFGRGRPDEIRACLSNGVLLLGATAAGIAALSAALWPWLDWAALFGVRAPALARELDAAVAAALIAFLLRFPLSTAGRLLLARQEGHVANAWGCASSLAGLGALLAATRAGAGLAGLVAAVSGAPLVVEAALNLWLYGARRPELRPRLADVRPGALRPLYRVGGQFFALQVMALVTLSTDNFVISHALGAAEVPAYSLTSNLFGYTGLPQAILFPYLWAAYGEAIARGDVHWVARTLALNLRLGVAFAAAAALGLLAVGTPFIAWWTGGAVAPPRNLLFWMAAWSVINALTSPAACLLAAASRMRWQIGYSALATAANLALSLALVGRCGSVGVIAGTVVAYAVFVCGPILVDVRGLLRALAAAPEGPRP